MALTDVKITELDLPFVKGYLKVDFSDDDNLLSTIILGAQSYIKTLLGYDIVTEYPNRDDIPTEFTIACLMIIAQWYDRRNPQTAENLSDEIKFAVSAIVDAYRRPLKEYDESSAV